MNYFSEKDGARLLVGIDIDGTITDFHTAVKSIGRVFFGKPVVNERESDVDKMFDVPLERVGGFWKKYGATPFPGRPYFLEFLQALKECGADWCVITHRCGELQVWDPLPEVVKKRTLKEISSYIARAGLEDAGNFKGVYFSTNDVGNRKCDIVNDLGVTVMIEDSKTMTSLVRRESGVPVYLMDTPYNAGLEMDGVCRVSSWSELVEKVKEVRLCEG